MSKLHTLLRYFPSGTAEGERKILEQVFVYANEFSQAISPPDGNPLLLVGDKGSGKSALIVFSQNVLKKQGVPAICLTPFDLETSSIADNFSTGDIERSFYKILLSSIAAKISEENAGWFSSDYAVLYKEAVDSGQRTSDFPARVGKFIATLAKPLVKLDMLGAFPQLTTQTRMNVEAALNNIVGSNSFYLFIDDTDQVANPDRPGHLNRIWGLLLAARRISSTVNNISVIISLRTEVWHRLQRDQLGQRDQTDHFRSLVVEMISDREHVAQILRHRLNLAANDVAPGKLPYKCFFEKDTATAPYSKDQRTWEDLITIRSRQRPRDAIQLVNTLAQKAISRQKIRMDEGDFHSVMPEFSRKISEQFADEVKFECPNALGILKTFADIEYDHSGFTMSSEIALSHFSKIPSRFSTVLHGRTLQPGNEADAFEIWRYFYICGVVNARVSDASKKDGFRHLNASEDISLVAKSRWNDLQKMLWEINTAYRDYLILLQKEKELVTGIPTKHTPGRRQRR